MHWRFRLRQTVHFFIGGVHVQASIRILHHSSVRAHVLDNYRVMGVVLHGTESVAGSNHSRHIVTSCAHFSAMDVWMLGCISFVFGTMVELAFVCYISRCQNSVRR
ncbi:hypothetical protein ANCCEY_05580 [Ancylostoma ceylanicum]|uniref:Uncharacterized protein n=1 Tax=Ancylostoma ceylanicum TaxID=53326 RepID=A0A0D6M612_9BILA|nr:hypothetical protein ANCCEY_05580 [Ancylostoma ceylanicum]